MTQNAHTQNPPPTGLLQLPTELLICISSLLHTPHLRRLSRVNRHLRCFITDYLSRYRYITGLAALPPALVLAIAQHLDSRHACSRLARASQRLYPLVMGHAVRENVQTEGSSLLNYAAKKNLKHMARGILRLGGDVNTHLGYRPRFLAEAPTPLATAAFYGHERMVRLFLAAGASQLVRRVRIPLALAMRKRRERVAVLLLQELEAGDVICEEDAERFLRAAKAWKEDSCAKLGIEWGRWHPGTTMGETVLQVACEKRMVGLVRYYLERWGGRATGRVVQERSAILCSILLQDAGDEGWLKRQLHEDVYQIVLMLLQHGADPDCRVGLVCSCPVTTARAVASRHPDPRVRALLLNPAPVRVPRAFALQIGRQWMISSGDGALVFQEAESEASPCEASRYATLWNFLGRLDAETATATVSVETEDGAGTNPESDPSNAPRNTDVVETAIQSRRKTSKPAAPPPLSSFPHLGTPKTGAQHNAKGVWAGKLGKAHPDSKSSTGSMELISQKVNLSA